MTDAAENAEARPVSVAISPGRSASVVAVASPAWVGATRVRKVASAQLDEPVLFDASERAEAAPPPAIVPTQGGPGVVSLAPDGALVALLSDARPGLRRPPERVVPVARALAVAADRSSSTVVAWDGLRVHAVTLDARGVPTSREVWLERGGKSARLCAAKVGSGVVAIAAFDDEPAVHVLSAGEKARAVRHDVGSPVVALSIAGAGNRGGCVLVLDGGGRIAVAELDAGGRFVERPSTRLEGRGVRWDAALALFVEDGFAVLARDPVGGTASLHRFAQDRSPLATLDRVTSSPAAAWHEKRLWIATATQAPGSDQVELTIQRSTLSARQPALVTPIVVAPPSALRAERARDRALRTVLEIGSELSTTTYRGGGEASTGVDREACAVVALGLRTAIEAGEDGYRLHVVARAPGAEADPIPSGSFERLARWVRERLSRKAWEAAAAEATWIEGLAGEIGGAAAMLPTEGGLVLTVTTNELPTAPVLVRWLRRIDADLRARRGAVGAEGQPHAAEPAPNERDP